MISSSVIADCHIPGYVLSRFSMLNTLFFLTSYVEHAQNYIFVLQQSIFSLGSFFFFEKAMLFAEQLLPPDTVTHCNTIFKKIM